MPVAYDDTIQGGGIGTGAPVAAPTAPTPTPTPTPTVTPTPTPLSGAVIDYLGTPSGQAVVQPLITQQPSQSQFVNYTQNNPGSAAASLAQQYAGASGLPGPSSGSLFDSNPLVAYANAEYAKGVTSLDGWLKGQQDLANAQGKTMSERLKRQRELARRALINRLAARGILRSGDLGYQEGQQAQNFADSSYDINQNVLQQLAGYWQQYLQQKNALRGVVDNAMTTAYQNQTTPENLSNGVGQPSIFAPTAAAGMGAIDWTNPATWGARR